MPSTDIISELRSYHARDDAFLREVLDGTADGVVPGLLPKLVLEIERHVVAEQVEVVPALREHGADEVADAWAASLREVDDLVHRLAQSAGWEVGEPLLRQIAQWSRDHDAWVESHGFPALVDNVPVSAIDEMADRATGSREAGPVGSHPDWFHPVSQAWPDDTLVDRLRAHLAETRL